jgi:hypothetical protein
LFSYGTNSSPFIPLLFSEKGERKIWITSSPSNSLFSFAIGEEGEPDGTSAPFRLYTSGRGANTKGCCGFSGFGVGVMWVMAGTRGGFMWGWRGGVF